METDKTICPHCKQDISELEKRIGMNENGILDIYFKTRCKCGFWYFFEMSMRCHHDPCEWRKEKGK